jgi:hypothetical protein
MGIPLFASFDSILLVKHDGTPSGVRFPVIGLSENAAEPVGTPDAFKTASVGGRKTSSHHQLTRDPQ